MIQAPSKAVYPSRFRDLSFYRVQAFEKYPHIQHAIFTRKGGVSQTPYHSLNLSTSVGDSPQAVQNNVHYACQAVNISPTQTVSCHLIHGSNVLSITKSSQQKVMGYADGLITRDPDIFLFMRFGDCIPLLFFDPVQNAIGLTHAGWRGTMRNAAGATVEEMVRQLGCRPRDIIAAIGPSIGPCCYEVGQDVINAAADAFIEPDSLFIRPYGFNDHIHFDMWEANRRQLVATGVEQIVHSGLCTACRTDEFFSHRAEKGRTGRFGVIIGFRGETE